MQSDEKVVESLTKRSGHVLCSNSVKQLLLIYVKTESVSSSVVGLVTKCCVQCQRVGVKAIIINNKISLIVS